MKISSKFSLNKLAIACVAVPFFAALTACGGGGSGGGNPSAPGSGQVGAAKFDVSVATEASVSLQPGTTMNFPGAASTSDAPLSSLIWSLTGPAGAPTLGTTNSSCAVGAKATNKTSSDWGCQISITAPVQAAKPTTYTLVLEAKDSLNNVRTVSRNVTVNFDPTYVPTTTVNVGQPFSVISGATAPLSCAVPAGSTVAWSVADNGGLPIALSSYGSSQTSFVAPTVTTATPITLTCSVTDAVKQTTAGNIVVTVQPAPPAPPPVVKITAAQSVKSLVAVSVTATAPTGYYFSWELVGTPTPTPVLGGSTTETVSFVAPTVTVPTTYILKVTYGTQPITASYTGTGTAQSVVVVTP